MFGAQYIVLHKIILVSIFPALACALACLFFLPPVFDEYKRISNKDITESIKSEMSGDFEDALLAVGECPGSRFRIV